MSTPPPLLTVEGMTCRHGSIVAVRDLGLEVREGEIVALLGPNGAGKSTTLRALSGMRPPQRGAITFAGRRIEGWPSDRIARLGMALVPEGRGLFTELSVEENLRMGGFAVDPGALEQRIEEVRATFPVLGERRAQRAGTLSGGEQQQLAIARALLSRPRLLMIDEMSLGLAPRVAAELYRTVLEVNRAGTAVLLVEQQVRLALSIAQRAYFIDRGQVRDEGPAQGFRDTEAVRRVYLGDAGGDDEDGAGDGDEPRVVERINVPLRPGDARALQQLARARGTGVGEVVAGAVEEYLDALAREAR